jgi:hypothetical protein
MSGNLRSRLAHLWFSWISWLHLAPLLANKMVNFDHREYGEGRIMSRGSSADVLQLVVGIFGGRLPRFEMRLFRSNVFNQVAAGAGKPLEPLLPETPYEPYSEKPSLSELPYKPYTEEPEPASPYEPYKDI